MSRREIIADLSTLTTIPVKTLDKLVTKSVWCIGDAIEETLNKSEEILSADIGIGVIGIQILNNEIKYKFTPSVQLEKCVREAVINGKNTLEYTVEKTLANKIINTYKDLL